MSRVPDTVTIEARKLSYTDNHIGISAQWGPAWHGPEWEVIYAEWDVLLPEVIAAAKEMAGVFARVAWLVSEAFRWDAKDEETDFYSGHKCVRHGESLCGNMSVSVMPFDENGGDIAVSIWFVVPKNRERTWTAAVRRWFAQVIVEDATALTRFSQEITQPELDHGEDLPRGPVSSAPAVGPVISSNPFTGAPLNGNGSGSNGYEHGHDSPPVVVVGSCQECGTQPLMSLLAGADGKLRCRRCHFAAAG
jgi:hypothetical protein